jgi:hypothetical protein
MEHIHDDGGRAAAGFVGKTGDCVTRAITIATGKDYQRCIRTFTRESVNMSQHTVTVLAGRWPGVRG